MERGSVSMLRNAVSSFVSPRSADNALRSSAGRLCCLSMLAAAFVETGCGAPHPRVSQLNRQCKQDENVRACFLLSNELARGTITTKDKAGASEIVRHATTLGRRRCQKEADAEVCHLLGARHYAGTLGGLKADKKLARAFFNRGCRLGSKRSCMMTALLKDKRLRRELDKSVESRDRLLEF